jgi:excinuclease ABC subunit B
VAAGDRVLVTTLTKRMAEELTKYLDRLGIGTRYIHSDVKTLDRVEILRQLRDGTFDVLVGVNLLREGLDIPEVALVAILDADKEGFLRSNRSLTQTAGRAARNVNGRVLFYADKITESMATTIDETSRRRAKQEAYNAAHGITPQQIRKARRTLFEQSGLIDDRPRHIAAEPGLETAVPAASLDPVLAAMTTEALGREVRKARKAMDQAARDMDFMEAARLRDQWFAMKALLEERTGTPA